MTPRNFKIFISKNKEGYNVYTVNYYIKSKTHSVESEDVEVISGL